MIVRPRFDIKRTAEPQPSVRRNRAGHLLARLAWEFLIDGRDNGVPRETDAALERAIGLIPGAVLRTMLGRMSDGSYLTWAVYGLDDKRQAEFLDRAWYEFVALIARSDG